MKDLSTIKRHPLVESLVDVLKQKTQSNNDLFFRVLTIYFLGKLASMMRASIKTLDRGEIPINIYAINLAASGQGKGFSKNIIEEHVINGFQKRFVEETLPILAKDNLIKLAGERALKNDTDEESELVKITNEYERLGEFAFSFDSGTTAAVKQMRHRLLMANAGSVNMEIDEIGSNLLSNLDVLGAFLELYDVGKIKQKLTKNTNENVRSEEIDGRTPTNMLLFGTPAKLFNGGKTEEEFWSAQETGYGRRCIFGYGDTDDRDLDIDAEELFNRLTQGNSDAVLEKLNEQITNLADIINFDKNILVSKDVTLIYLEYKLECERQAKALPEHEQIRKAEISHRYFKALKIAGALAFVDDTHEITEEQMYAAILYTEESGAAFFKMSKRDKNYVKLAKYISSTDRSVTNVDLVEDLPFYKGSQSQKNDLMNLAIAWAYQNHIVIKKSYMDGIEFLSGEKLKETSLEEITLSYSDDFAHGYEAVSVPFSDLPNLTQEQDLHFCNHAFVDEHRLGEKSIPGFNVIILDVDGGVPLSMAQELLKDYTYHMYTTKRHTENEHRYRIILPTNYILELDEPDYKEFMDNIFGWLPFEVDTKTGQRCKKWMTNPGNSYMNEGELFDVLPFIPRTSKNEERKQKNIDSASLSNLERWFLNNTGSGNRNDQLVKYALLLVDCNRTIDEVRDALLALNKKLPDKLDETEILSTIMISVTKAIAKRNP